MAENVDTFRGFLGMETFMLLDKNGDSSYLQKNCQQR